MKMERNGNVPIECNNGNIPETVNKRKSFYLNYAALSDEPSLQLS